MGRRQQKESRGLDHAEPYVVLQGADLPGWVLLELDERVPARRWCTASVNERVARQGGSSSDQGGDGVVSLEQALVIARQTSVGLAPASWAFQPSPAAEVLAVVDAAVHVVVPALRTVEALAADLSAEPSPVGPKEVTYLQHEIGAAVRLRQFAPTPQGTVIETMTFAILPPELPAVLLVHAQWHVVGLAEELGRQTDALVGRIRLQVSDGG